MIDLTIKSISFHEGSKCAYCGNAGTRYKIKLELITETFCSKECAEKYCEQYKAKHDGRLIL